MRYDDWDVILFPKESHVPTQEFKTACYVSPEEFKLPQFHGRPLPTLTCYISSLPPSTPFRVSIHSWATATKASPIIESRRKANQKIVYSVQVIVDGARVFRGFFDIHSKWPQEIAHERRSLAFTEHPTSRQKLCLQFPPFHQHTLMQNSWDACDPNGRIKIMLSEQLIGKTSSPGDMDLGITNDIVCFSFQHAPKDILERAGISWPIRNPLYFPNAQDRDILLSRKSPTISWTPKSRPLAADVHMQSPLSHASKSAFARPQNLEPNRRLNAHLPPISNFAKLQAGSRGSFRTRTWDDSLSSLGDGDEMTMDTWSTKPTTSGSTNDMPMYDYMYTSSHSSRPVPPWMSNIPPYDQNLGTDWDEQRSMREKDRQLVVTLREDQLGQIIEALSPPKQSHEQPNGSGNQRHGHSSRPPTAHTYYPPKMGNNGSTNRSTSALMARKSTYPDFNSALRNAATKQSPSKQYSNDMLKDRPLTTYQPSMSSHKENRSPSQARLPTPFPIANRVPTPNPFSQRFNTANSDITMRDPSSAQSSMHRFNRSEAPPPPSTQLGKFSSAHGPSTVNIRSRKEGMAADLPKLSDHSIRHDQSLLPAVGTENSMHKNMFQKSNIPSLVEVIDVDAIDPHLHAPSTNIANTTSMPCHLSPFKTPRPKHKNNSPSLSSIDSTGRLERQLFSALGEELACFDPRDTNTLHKHQHQDHEREDERDRDGAGNPTQGIDTQGMGPELALALGGGLATPKANTHFQHRGPEKTNAERRGGPTKNTGSWLIERASGDIGLSPRGDKSLNPTASDFEPMGKRKRDAALECNIDGDVESDEYERRGKRERSETGFEGDEEEQGNGELEREAEMEREEVVVCVRGG
ncbi:hypothetical protein TUN199_10079 [Pyrenophora tritici-repentis]|nr:hypothetical protein Alg130_07466 [Pyrenophora tritici-repentis]KAI0608563.1 hypothetical protein TUN205_07199 [Pyrenophora tritici-repentis]KAI0617929.1 hypothetical protein TUN199_10079 [Pyrenophora tritici-repentis]